MKYCFVPNKLTNFKKIVVCILCGRQFDVKNVFSYLVIQIPHIQKITCGNTFANVYN